MNPMRCYLCATVAITMGLVAGPLLTLGKGNLQRPERVQSQHLQAPDVDSDQWSPLADAEDLSDWVAIGGTATFEIKQGTIIGRTAIGSPSTYLCTQQTYSDFELTFEVWLEGQLNSGVQVRSIRRDGKGNASIWGPQIEIEPVPEDDESQCETGYVFSEGTGRGWISQNRVLNDVFINNQWNRFSIRAVGPRIQVWVNGRKVEDVLDESAAAKGLIALQVHSVPNGSPQLEARWRDLRIRELR